MHKINSVADLRASILLLEIKQLKEGQLLKEQFNITSEGLKPANLVKNTLSELAASPGLKGNLLNATIGLAAGYVSKKVLVGATHNPLRQLLGAFLQMGVSGIVSKNPDGIKQAALKLVKIFSRKKETTAQNDTRP